MRRLLALALVGGLVFGSFGAAEAAKKKKKKPPQPPAPTVVSVEQKMFLRGNSCSGENRDWLSTTDADEALECWYTGAGLPNELLVASGQRTREAVSREWEAQDGIPFVLDATKPLTGEITTASGCGVLTALPCSPVGVGAGEHILDITVIGVIGGADKELGKMTETFTILPGQTHTTKLNIKLDASANGATLDGIKVLTYQHGRSVGHGIIKTNDPNSSFVSFNKLVSQ